MAEFLEAIDTVLNREEADSDVAGSEETRFGLSQRNHPELDIKRLTFAKARQTYLEKYWIPGRYGRIRDQAVATAVFSLAINIGAKAAHEALQHALKAIGRPVAANGVLRPAILREVNEALSGELLAALQSATAGGAWADLATQDPV